MNEIARGHNSPPISSEDLRVAHEQLRWCCDSGWLPFESTAEVEPVGGIIGQDDAVGALQFGLEIDAPGQNIFVRGLVGTGRMSLVKQLIKQIQPACPLAKDRCYVHNFAQPSRPRLISLPRGQAKAFATRVDKLIEFIQKDLAPSLSSEMIQARRAALDDRIQSQMRQLDEPLKQELAANNLALVPVQAGQTVQPAIFPVINNETIPPDRFKQLRTEGKISQEQADAIHAKTNMFAKRLQKIGAKVRQIQIRHETSLQQLYQEEARSRLDSRVACIEQDFPHNQVKGFLSEIVADVVSHRLGDLEKDTSFLRQYRVNVVLRHDADENCPFIIENTPTLGNLLGGIEREFLPGGTSRWDHLMIACGSLLRADGGYLIMEARDVLTEPGAWKALLRVLRSNKLEIVPNEFQPLLSGPHLKPEPIDINVKVILLGDPGIYHLLNQDDPDFSHLFKVLADFDTTIERNQRGAQFYAKVLSRIIQEENLPHFSRGAVTALIEHGARIAAQRQRLTTRFGRLADLAREAAFLTKKRGQEMVDEAEVREAVRLSRHRADLPARRFARMVSEGTIHIQIQGSQVGQINGLAVIHAGPLTYGFPTRITATVGAGSAGTINIEREAELSGAIHTKGFYILGGLLRFLLRTDHPLTFSASIAFEQSYGGIDGDSASGAEMCCLLSALTGTPLRQDLAMTGAIDQLGHIQPVGAVAEKIEGFFDICRAVGAGTAGSQGVIIPRSTVEDLMLRQDVAEACGQGKFHVYAVGTIHEALQILTGRSIGQPDESGAYPEGTLLHDAQHKAKQYWHMTMAGPNDPG